MAQKTKSFGKFWKELKRRKVVHVITVYAATAFVILELVNNIARPLQLPNWTEAFVIVLLCIGFIISVVVSWVYDITPSGVRKTKPISAVKHANQPTNQTSRGWKIATFISAILIVALLVVNLISKRDFNSNLSKLEKSIAVLPFINDSSSDSTAYFVNGLMDEILISLQRIGAFSKVSSRTSTEKYRNPDKSIPEIAEELGVNFIVEGSGQKYGDFYRTRVQLIEGKTDKHLWVDSYEREINSTTDFFGIQSQIAQDIATELKVVISPGEKELIEKNHTESIKAWDLYLRANNYLFQYEKTRDTGSYQNALIFYKAALSIDPSFAKAYTGLGSLFLSSQVRGETFFKENYLDTILILADKALASDYKLEEAYYLKGRYFKEIGDYDKALKNFDDALKINPNYYEVFNAKGSLLTWDSFDIIKCINNYNNAINLCGIDDRPGLLRDLGFVYLTIGFSDKANYFFNEAYLLDKNEEANLYMLANHALYTEKIEEGVNILRKFAEKGHSPNILLTVFCPPDEAYSYAKRLEENYQKSGKLNLQESHRIGYAFYRAGKKAEAINYFDRQIKYDDESISLKRMLSESKSAQYDLAATYAFLGEKDKAYKYLEEFNKRVNFSKWWVILLKYDPLFDKIRKEERFQKMLQNTEAKYQAEHERVRKWLEENDML